MGAGGWFYVPKVRNEDSSLLHDTNVSQKGGLDAEEREGRLK
jgi:hypothetical protein